MDCTKCRTANRENARFCSGCGTALAQLCASCGAELGASAKFCDQCGTPTEAKSARTARTSAARKTVTVVFCDLGGSTSFGERTDPELTREVMGRYHALLQDTIDTYDGTVAKFMGDGMMATFGIPEIAEDDAARAVHAGVDLQRRFTDFAANVREEHGEDLTLRVGVNTGEIVIADGDADLIGDALNVAARLEHACRPGNVLVGEETWRLTRAEFGYESLGEVTVAGRGQPVAIFEVSSGGSATVDTAAPFVGRDLEMQRLRAAFDSAGSARAARLVTVLGSPGVGKTRLSREFCAAVETDTQASTFEVRCDRAGDATFAPIAQLIREAIGVGDDAEDANASVATTRVAALLADDEPDRDRLAEILAGLVGAAPARSVEETFWAIRRLVIAVASTRPMVVVIDDIQWAEPLLLDLLEHLAEWVQHVPLMLLCLARPELRDVRPSLAVPGRRVEDVLALDGLDSTATEQLAAGLLGTDHLPLGLVARLPASTDGNPLFVRELVRMLVDDQVIRPRDGAWELAIDADAVEVPPTIQSLLAARVERLPDNERSILELGSVIGAEFSLGALRELAPPGTALTPLLEGLRRKELVEPTGTYWGDEPVHRFHHVLIRDSAYRRLLKTTRADLHERVAVWTDQTSAGVIGEHEAVVAYHYEQAYQYRQELGSTDEHVEGLGRRASELLSTAADRALGRDDLAAAGGLARRALDVLAESDATARAALLLIACECLLSSGDVAAARSVVDQLRELGGNDATLGAWAACFKAQLIGLTDPDALVEAEATATSAAAVMEELGDGAGEAKAHQVRAGLLARLGRVGDAELELDLALGAARRVDDRRRVTAVLGAAPVAALWGPSPVARAGGRCLDVVRLLRITTASPSVEATSMRCQAVLEALRGRFDVSRSMLASARASLEELGLRHGLLETEYLAGVVELIADDPSAAIGPLRIAYEGLGEMGVDVDAGRAAALLARALLAEGQVDAAAPMAAASEALAGQDLKTAIAWRVAQAEVLAARGDLTAGIALAEKAAEIAGATDLIIDHAEACVALAGLRDAAGDIAGTQAARADALRLYEAKGATVPAQRLSERGSSRAPEDGPEPEPRPPIERPARPELSGARTDRAENSATWQIARFVELASAGRFDEAGALIAADHVRVDNRNTVSAPATHSRDDTMASVRAIHDVGMTEWTVEPLAVRGDRLFLSRFSFRTPTGSEVVLLVVSENGADGLGIYTAEFDEDDLDAASDDLDARYAAGEGADHADMVRAMHEFGRSLAHWDLERHRATLADDFVMIDRRELGWPEFDQDGYIAMQGSYAEAFSFHPISLLARTSHVVGRAGLVTNETRGVRSDGTHYEWVFHGVGVINRAGLLSRLELFAEDDFETALARLDELGATDPRHPRAENMATRLLAQVVELAHAGRFDLARELGAEDFVRFDRRRGVSAPTAQGRDEFISALEALFDVGFEHITVQPLAVRGDRLSLQRVTNRTSDGYEMVYLLVAASDADDRVVATWYFDEDALVDAVAELDAHHLTSEQAPHARLLSVAAAGLAAFDASDFDALGEMLASDFVVADHAPIGWGTGGTEMLSPAVRSAAELGITQSRLNRVVHIAGTALLAVQELHQVTEQGNEYSQEQVLVMAVDGSDHIRVIDLYPIDDFDAALARLDELGALGGVSDVRPPALENEVTRNIQRLFDLGAAGAVDLGGLVTEDIVRFDTRRSVSTPTLHGRAEFEENLRAIYDVFDSGALEPIAIRGERVALTRVILSHDGFAATMLGVYETNEQGLLCRGTSFDEEDLEAALDELDERYCAGEGAEHAYLIGRLHDDLRAIRSRDLRALESVNSAEFTVVDHRRLGYGSLDGDALHTVQGARFDQTLDYQLLHRWWRITGDVVLGEAQSGGTTPEGNDYAWSFLFVMQLAGGKWIHLEMFEVDDREAAQARFEELAAEPRTLDLDNDAVRAVVRLAWLGMFDRPAAVELLADDLDSFADVFADVSFETLAVRGDRLALLRYTMTADGLDAPGLLVAEVDAENRLCLLETFDETDLAASFEKLEARHREVGGGYHP